MNTRVDALLRFAAVVSMCGCTNNTKSALTLDTSTPSARDAALVGGPLQGEVVDGHACFWVTSDDGLAVSLVWPEGSVAQDNPLRVVNADGKTIAQVGDSTSQLRGNPSSEAGCYGQSTRFVLGAVK